MASLIYFPPLNIDTLPLPSFRSVNVVQVKSISVAGALELILTASPEIEDFRINKEKA
jgi:hypothetical protein